MLKYLILILCLLLDCSLAQVRFWIEYQLVYVFSDLSRRDIAFGMGNVDPMPSAKSQIVLTMVLLVY